MSFSLLAIELKDTLETEGCAVCRLVQEGDQRHVRIAYLQINPATLEVVPRRPFGCLSYDRDGSRAAGDVGE